jgi:hypothetical protein
MASDKHWKTKANELRQLYPFESMTERLTYEEKARQAGPPVLPTTANKRLEEAHRSRKNCHCYQI